MGSFTNPYPASRLTVDSTNSLVTGMQAFFPLTEGSGSVVDCILHPSHTGTVTNGTWQTGDGGTELFLSGSGSFVTIGDLNLNSANGLTVTAWIDGGSYGGNDQIVTRDNSGGSRHWQFRTGTSGNLNLIRFNSGNSLVANFSGSTSLTNGVRYFVAFTFDSSSGSVLYVNGEVDGTDSNTTANNSGTGTDILIGARRSSGVISDSLPAAFQNVRVYERALSASEIATLYHRPWEGTNYGDIWPYSPPASASMTLSTDTAATSLLSGMQAWFPLTQGSGTVAQCILHPSHTGTLGSGVTWESSERGTVASFDGTSNAKINFSSQLVSGQTLSFSVWLYVASSVTGRRTIYCDGATWVQNDFRYDGNGKRFVFDHYTPGGEPNKTSGDYGVDDRWIHVVVTQDSSTTKIYYDGVLKHTGTAETYASSAPTAFNIGSRDGSDSFDGKMQNFQAWDRVISADEVALLHSRPWEGIEYGDTFHHDPPAPASMLPLTSDAINTDQVGWWPLTETDDYASGAADISGNSNTGTKSGGVTSQHSLTGSSADFDNTGHIDVGKSFWDSGIVSANAFTFNAWFNVDNNTADHGIFGSWNSASEALNIWVDVGGTNLSLTAICGDGTTQAITSVNAPIVTTGQWHMGTVIFDGSANTLKVYLDGVYSNENSSATATLTTAPMGFHIGDDGSTSRTTEGLIQNCRLWSRVLTADEVWSIYANPWLGSNYKLASGSTPLYNYIFRTERFRRLG